MTAAGQKPPQFNNPSAAALILGFKGKVEVRKKTLWEPARTNQVLEAGDTIRTGENSQAVIQYASLKTIPLRQFSTLRIEQRKEDRGAVSLLKGVLFFFNRDRPEELEVRTPRMSALTKGTEFVLRVDDDGSTTLTLLAGEVFIENELGTLTLHSGEEAIAEPGQPPRKTARIDAINVIQWRLYYPGVLDPQQFRGWNPVAGRRNRSQYPERVFCPQGL